jgi:hypothetical protein
MISYRQRKKQAEQLFKQPAGRLEPCDLTKAQFIPKGMTRAFRNNRYVVMIFDNEMTTGGKAIRVMVQKHDDTPITFHWREMQNIKNEIFGPEETAVEYYPAQSNLLDDHNIYWMWVFPKGVLPIPCI